MQFLEDFAIAVFDGLTGIFDRLHEKLRARRAKKRARDKGGQLKPGLNTVLNHTRKDEPALSKDQWHVVANLRHESMENFVKQLDQESRKQARMAAASEPLNLAKALQDKRKELADAKQKLAKAEAKIAILQDQQRNQTDTEALEALDLFQALDIKNPGKWMKHAAQLAAAGATDTQMRTFAKIAGSGHFTWEDKMILQNQGIEMTFGKGYL